MKHSLYKSFGFAVKGIRASLQERNKRIQSVCALGVIAAGFYFHITTTEWCIALLCIALVLCLEMINSAIEQTVDLLHPGIHEKAGRIKDIAAGAVLLASIITVVIGCLIFGKYVMGLL